MPKGDNTRAAILDRALQLTSVHGLTGITIGQLADAMSLSKSGLFAHFKSKEALQVAVLERAAALFERDVIGYVLQEPPGEKRVRALFERWLSWVRHPDLPGGCVFITASVELDDQPGAVRVWLVAHQRGWVDLIAECAREAVDAGQFRRNLDGRRFAQDLQGLLLAHYHFSRLLADPDTESRTRAGFEFLVARSRIVS